MTAGAERSVRRGSLAAPLHQELEQEEHEQNDTDAAAKDVVGHDPEKDRTKHESGEDSREQSPDHGPVRIAEVVPHRDEVANDEEHEDGSGGLLRGEDRREDGDGDDGEAAEGSLGEADDDCG